MGRDIPRVHGALISAGASTLIVAVVAGCSESRLPPGARVLSAEMPLHLEEHLASAMVEGSHLPAQPPEPEEWRFDDPGAAWKPVGFGQPPQLPRVEQVGDAVRITLPSEEPSGGRQRHGGLYVELPDWNLEDWAYVVVRLRTSSAVDHLELGINLSRSDTEGSESPPFEAWVPQIPVIDDGSVQSYILRLDQFGEHPPQGTWRELGIVVGSPESVSADLLSVSIVPKEADYATAPYGVRISEKGGEHRRALFTHGRSRLEYTVRVPEGGRLDFGIAALREEPVTFRVSASVVGEAPAALFEETYLDSRAWAMRSVDLSSLVGQTASLILETEANDGTVALWGSPILSGERPRSLPNVVFYIIDGGGADYMSLLGYNRSNTPNLSRLARQGALFERAYSSASWTKPSTASFMTSIPHSALGGFRSDTDRVPDGAVTMAEHLHTVGYMTGIIVSNPYAASLSGLERGADYLHQTGIEPNNSESSRLLHESFWRWRSAHPAEPYWVHFQSTDIHEPFDPVAPYSGLYVDPSLRERYEEWDPKLYPGGGWRDPAAYEEHGIDVAHYAHAQQGLYDEAMAHNDARIGELVDRIRERGEWENTLLIVAADHGYPAACHRLMEPSGPMWGPMLNSHETHVPMLFVWPGHIAPGQRFTDPVSMLDMLPTVLDLLGLEASETAQGRSLAPLLLGTGDWEPQPIFLDEFSVDAETGELKGLIEVIDGWWGASLEIGDGAANDVGGVGPRTDEHRPTPLLLYDLRSDPYTQRSLHEEYPELVEEYTRVLQRRWQAHLRLGETLGEGGQVSVGSEQLEALRALGYLD